MSDDNAPSVSPTTQITPPDERSRDSEGRGNPEGAVSVNYGDGGGASQDFPLAAIDCTDDTHLFIGRSLHCQCGALVAVPAAVANAAPDEDLEEFGPRLSLKDVRQLRALKAYMQSGRVNVACEAAGVKYGAWYRWLDTDPDFARAFEQAKEILADDLEGVAMERARASSDTLLIALLKALRPEKYREKQTITLVSPDVVSRLSRQADSILQICKAELEPHVAGIVAARIAESLRDIWS